jgi:hypothetical protein
LEPDFGLLFFYKSDFKTWILSKFDLKTSLEFCIREPYLNSNLTKNVNFCKNFKNWNYLKFKALHDGHRRDLKIHLT